MRLISAWKNFILGTWISEAGLSGADSRVRPCPVAWACTADAAAVKPAAKAAPDCRKVLLVFDICVLSFPPPRLTPVDMITPGVRDGIFVGNLARSLDDRPSLPTGGPGEFWFLQARTGMLRTGCRRRWSRFACRET